MDDWPTVSECRSVAHEDNSEAEDDAQTIQTTDELQDDSVNNTSQAGTATQNQYVCQQAISHKQRPRKPQPMKKLC